MSPPTTGDVFARLAVLAGIDPPEVPARSTALALAYHDLVEAALAKGTTWRQIATATGTGNWKIAKRDHGKLHGAVERQRAADKVRASIADDAATARAAAG